MKRYVSFLLIMLFSVTVIAQSHDRGKKRERIKALKTAFITEKLNLSIGEAETFWPVYNEFSEKEAHIKFNTIRGIKIKVKRGFDEISDAEASKLLDNLTIAEDKLHKLRANFITDLKTILPAKKIMLLKAVEDEFNRKMLEEFKKRRQSHNKN